MGRIDVGETTQFLLDSPGAFRCQVDHQTEEYERSEIAGAEVDSGDERANGLVEFATGIVGHALRHMEPGGLREAFEREAENGQRRF